MNFDLLFCWSEDTESEAEELVCEGKHTKADKLGPRKKNLRDVALLIPSNPSTKRRASAITNLGDRNKKPKLNFERSDSEGLDFIPCHLCICAITLRV